MTGVALAHIGEIGTAIKEMALWLENNIIALDTAAH